MYPDLNDFLADLDKRRLLARVGEPVSPELEIAAVTDRACKAAGRRTCAAVRAAGRVRHPGGDQRVRIDRADVSGARREVARRSGGGDQRADDAAMPQGIIDALKMLPAVARLKDLMPKTVKDAACQEVVREHGHARRAANPEMLARRRRPVHHAAARLHEGSRDRHAQHRHLPDAGVRWPHDRHALAAAQGGRAASPRRRAPG